MADFSIRELGESDLNLLAAFNPRGDHIEIQSLSVISHKYVFESCSVIENYSYQPALNCVGKGINSNSQDKDLTFLNAFSKQIRNTV